MRLILVYPETVKPSPGFDLLRDNAFKQLQEALNHARPIDIQATFEGRFDAAFYWRDRNRIRVGQSTEKGYGRGHRYDGRIVLRRVYDVTATPLPRR